jgi:hypothetical protein
MVWLRIELFGKSFDLFPVDPQPAGGKDLACSEVLKIEIVHFLSAPWKVLRAFIGRELAPPATAAELISPKAVGATLNAIKKGSDGMFSEDMLDLA